MLPAGVAGNVVTFAIADGQLGDDDLVANGTIVDQGGPGDPAEAIPVLSPAALLLLALALAALAQVAIRFS